MISIFSKIFPWLRETDEEELNIRFGRYSDAYKTEKQYNYWDKATHSFEQAQYLDAYEAFFNYLKDEKEDNVHFERKGKQIDFTLIQGSKQITGTATEKRVSAVTDVVRSKELNVGFMRKLVTMNYTLQYTRFALNNDIICMRFDTSVIDGSPDKLYFALKEMGTRADKQDDLLVNTFDALEPINNKHIEALPPSEKEIKFTYLHKYINDKLNTVNVVDNKKYAGATAYILLNLAYKLDYLIMPEGKLMDSLEQIHLTYFTQSEMSGEERISRMVRKFKEILDIAKETIFEELYRVKATFGVSNPTLPQQLVALIDSEMPHAIAFKGDKQVELALDVIEYIVQYCMFYYGLPKPTQALFRMMIRMFNAEYFRALGIQKTYYHPKTKKLNKSEIRREINNIQKQAQVRYPKFRIKQNNLQYNSLVDFVIGLLKEMRELNYSK